MNVNLKRNEPVKATGSRGNAITGRFAGIEDKGPGQGGGVFVKVNIAEEGKKAEIKLYRPKAVAPVVAATTKGKKA